MKRTYLDHNATTPTAPEVRAAMAPFLEAAFGNPSSIHAEGRAARHAVETARAEVAALCGAAAEEVIFTSGGTESDNLAIVGLALAARAADARRTRVVSSPVEHPAVVASVAALAARGFAVSLAAVDGAGRVDADEVGRLCGSDVALLTLQLANHELGTLQPLAAAAAHARAAGARVHTDAVQAAGKVALTLDVLGVDALSISAHKLYGPKGAGALVLRRGVALAPLLVGGHQERERRPGTENVAAVVGFGAAARRLRARGTTEAARVERLRDRLEAGLVAQGARVHGGGARVGNTTNLAWDGVAGELVVISLDLVGVAASTGAACTSGLVEPSPVVLALGLPRARAAEAVRFSLGWDNDDGDVDRVLALLPEILARIRAA